MPLLPARHTQLAQFRLGLWIDDPALPLSGEVRAGIQPALTAFAAEGAQVEVDHPMLDLADMRDLALEMVLNSGLAGGDAAAGSGATAGPAREELVRRRRQMHRAWAEWFSRYDAIICPVMPLVAFPHDVQRPFAERVVDIDGWSCSHLNVTAWTQLVSMSYLPATAVPVGRTPRGLPVGVQVVGPFQEDRTALAVARALCAVLGG